MNKNNGDGTATNKSISSFFISCTSVGRLWKALLIGTFLQFIQEDLFHMIAIWICFRISLCYFCFLKIGSWYVLSSLLEFRVSGVRVRSENCWI